MNNGRRILYIVHRSWPYRGGAETLFYEWALSSRREGFDVTIFTTDAWDIEYFHDRTKQRIDCQEETFEGIKIIRFRIFTIPFNLQWAGLKLLSAMPSEYCKYVFGYPHILLPGYLFHMISMKEKYDLIHAGVFPHLFLMYPALTYSRRKGIPAVCSPLIHTGEPHSVDISKHFLGDKHVELLKMSDRITVSTLLEKECLHKSGLQKDNINVISPGIYPDKIQGGNGARFRSRYGIRGKMVLQISTQTFDKGSQHVIEAMKHIWNKGSDAFLVLIGQTRDDFNEYFLGQPPHVYEKTIVMDYVDQQTKKDALDACDVFVMASRADSFGIVYLEAWAYRKPVIGVYAGGVPCLIDDGKDGFLVPFADVHMLSEYLQLLFLKPELSHEFGSRGHMKVMRNYTWQESCGKLQDLYTELLRSHENRN